MYYVREVESATIDGTEVKASSSITKMSAPFYVYLPMTAQNTNGQILGTTSGAEAMEGENWLETVDVYPKNLTTLGGATLTKTINGKYFSEITEEEENLLTEYPAFTLYKKGAEGEEDTPISSEISVSGGRIQGNLILDTVVDTYDAAKIFMQGGIIAVDGLPVGTYVFKETTQAVYDGQTLPQAPDCVFTVTAGHNYDVVTDQKSDDFGKITAVTAGDDPTQFAFTVDNASTPTVTKTVDENVTAYTVANPDKTADSPDDVPATVSAKTFTEGDRFTYKISITSPTDIADYKKYEITDTIDGKLTYVDRTIGIQQDTGEFEKNEDNPEDETLYPVYNTFTINTDFTYTYENNLLKITFTETGIDKIIPGKPVEITFDCQINSDAVVNTGIKNTATLAWTNKADRSGTSASDPVYVATLGYTMAKVDSEARTALEGAEFEIYRFNDYYERTEENLADMNCYNAPVYFTTNNGVYTAQVGSTDSTTVTSDANGMIKIEGLAGGTYKLVETKAPSGYQLLTQPVTITVSTTSNTAITDLSTASTSAARIVPNVKQPDLPITGGMGTLLFTVGGLLLSGGAVFAYVWFKKRRANEEKA